MPRVCRRWQDGSSGDSSSMRLKKRFGDFEESFANSHPALFDLAIIVFVVLAGGLFLAGVSVASSFPR